MSQVKLRQQRLYEKVWTDLRKTQSVTLVLSDGALLPRIKRGISKEKDLDTGFKLINDEKFYLKYEWNATNNELKIELLTNRFDLVAPRG